jgi:hypothetical protein
MKIKSCIPTRPCPVCRSVATGVYHSQGCSCTNVRWVKERYYLAHYHYVCKICNLEWVIPYVTIELKVCDDGSLVYRARFCTTGLGYTNPKK